MAMEQKPRTKMRTDAFTRAAFWQFMAFIFLLCFVWANEIFDFSALMFGESPVPFSLYRAFLLSAAVIATGVVTVGDSYERQRALVKRLTTSCAYCHRVKSEDGGWMYVEDFFLSHYPVGVERGVCAECQSMLKSVDAKGKGTPDDAG